MKLFKLRKKFTQHPNTKFNFTLLCINSKHPKRQIKLTFSFTDCTMQCLYEKKCSAFRQSFKDINKKCFSFSPKKKRYKSGKKSISLVFRSFQITQIELLDLLPIAAEYCIVLCNEIFISMRIPREKINK